jgi:hypothetical protein
VVVILKKLGRDYSWVLASLCDVRVTLFGRWHGGFNPALLLAAGVVAVHAPRDYVPDFVASPALTKLTSLRISVHLRLAALQFRQRGAKLAGIAALLVITHNIVPLYRFAG